VNVKSASSQMVNVYTTGPDQQADLADS